jgi:hypothetical protein
MRAWSLGIVALVVITGPAAHAQAPRWHLDAGAAGLVEAWDYNESREAIAGVTAGVDARVWKLLAVRTEGLVLHVTQSGRDAWLRGVTLGVRGRWHHTPLRPFVELAGGISTTTAPVPPRGTSFNYLLVSGGGVAVPLRGAALDLGLRWLHVSNNGREGRHRNPDIQSLGVTAAVSVSLFN